jgi:transcriptional regulator with XRE-family HTH domain
MRRMRCFRPMSRAPSPDPALGVVLRQLRESRGLTQESLAFRSGVSMSSLGRIELGRTSAAWATVVQLADALDVSMADLGAAIESWRERGELGG